MSKYESPMGKHKPVLLPDGCYYKYEVNDDFLFRKSMSISIRASILECCDYVVVELSHRGVTVRASKEDIKKYNDVLTWYGETKYYYPIYRWDVVDGDEEWVEGLHESLQIPRREVEASKPNNTGNISV